MKYSKDLFRYTLLILTLTLPFNRAATNLFIFILAIVWISEGGFLSKVKLLSTKPLIIYFIVFYLLYGLGMLYTENLPTGLGNLEKKYYLLALPLIIGTSLSYDKKIRNEVLLFFVLTCWIATFLCLGNAFYQFVFNNNITFFFHEDLSSVINFHPPYFAMYLSLAIFICLWYLKMEWNNLSFVQRSGITALIIYFIFFVLLLSARTSTLFLVLFFIGGSFYFMIKKRVMLQGLIVIILFLLILIITIGQSAYLTDRIIRPLKSDISAIDGGRETGLSIRLVKWKCSIEGIKESPFFGTGTGDAVDYLVVCYEKLNFWGMYPQYRFNSHNQYLETGLTLGVMGFSLLLICIIIPARAAWKRSDYLFLLFTLLFSFCSLTESLLERQWGIVFFTFFISIFYFADNPEK